MNQYKVAIIGCGSIGALKPEHIDYPNSPNILTHCNSIDRHMQTELMAIVDTNDKQLMKAKEKWNPQLTVKTYDELISGNPVPDIVILAVPTEHHYETMLNIFSHPTLPKLIIAEKPFCSNSIEAEEIASLSKEKCTDGRRKVPIMIDYIRRYATGYQEIKKQIDSEDFGEALNCRVLYTRGLKHEGCHALDLMRYFFGKYAGGHILQGGQIIDRNSDDPTYEIEMWFEKCFSVVFQPCDGRLYGIFEIDICFEKCRLRFIDNGLYVEKYSIAEENEWGHKSLDYSLSNVLRTETGLTTALYNLVDNAVKFLDGEEDLICTADDAVAVHEILDHLK